MQKLFAIFNRLFLAATPTVGGQAVMEGVMMRNKDTLAIAVRRCDGEIVLKKQSWFSMIRAAWLKKPFIRGFPVLIETMVNGIKALNFSATIAMEDESDDEVKPWALLVTLIFSIAMAIGLFVVLPHMLSLGIEYLGYGGDTSTFSFHAWDGFFKLAIFLSYIIMISFLPDIKRVFQYHGAEHKVIWTYEEKKELTIKNARKFSRLHPRCGTTFLLFVLSLAIIMHTLLVPALSGIYSPQNEIIKQAYIIFAKILMMIPISALAYELIKFTACYGENKICKLLCAPGLALQCLTTFEPDDKQIEVAIAALNGALEK